MLDSMSKVEQLLLEAIAARLSNSFDSQSSELYSLLQAEIDPCAQMTALQAIDFLERSTPELQTLAARLKTDLLSASDGEYPGFDNLYYYAEATFEEGEQPWRKYPLFGDEDCVKPR